MPTRTELNTLINTNLANASEITAAELRAVQTAQADYTDQEVAKKANTSHTHAIGEVISLQAALDAKASVSSVTSEATTRASADTALQALITALQNKVVTGIAFTGGSTKTLTLTFADATTLTATFTDNSASGGTGANWGEIGGDIEDQTDLQALITAALASLVDTAPATLNTLNELAAALGDDPNFATTITNLIAAKANAVHTHSIGDVTGLQAALDSKQGSGDYATNADLLSVQAQLDADIQDLQTQINEIEVGGGTNLRMQVANPDTYGNDSADATAHLQALHDAALAGHKVVYIPAGIYRITSLNWNPAVRFIGAGVRNTVLKGTAAGAMVNNNTTTSVFAFSPNYDMFTGIQFDGNSTATNALDIQYIGWFKFTNLYFHHFTGKAVDTTGVLIGEWNSCTWDENPLGAYKAAMGTDAVYGVMQSNLLTFTNCNFFHSATSGDNFAVELNQLAHVSFRYNNFEYNGTAGNANSGSILFNNPSPAGEGVGLLIDGCWWERGRGTLVKIGNPGGSCRHTVRNTLMQFPLASGDVVYAIHLTGTNTNVVSIYDSKITHAGSTAELYATGAGARFEYQNSEIRNYSVNSSATIYHYPPTLIATGAAPDVTAPTLSSATVEDAAPNQIVLTYNESLNTSSVPATTDFTVSGGKTVTNVGVAGAVVTLTVNSAYIAGDVITVSYTAGTNPIEDLAGNNAGNLSGQSVTNNIGGVANLLTAGSDFANAAWTKTNLTISSDAATDHNGLLTADKLTPNTTNAVHSLKQTISKASSAITYKLEGYVKADAYPRFTAAVDQGGHGAYLSVNASTGGVTDQGVYGAGFTLSAYSLTPAANGYYKFSMTFTTNAASSLDVFFYVTNPTTGANSHAGNGTDGMLLTNVTLVQQ